MIVVFFFFQAEDGIRDIGVTGVQTCALPICLGAGSFSTARYGVGPRTSLALWAKPFVASRPAPAIAAKAIQPEIGRASCRERVEISVVAVSLKKKTMNYASRVALDEQNCDAL